MEQTPSRLSPILSSIGYGQSDSERSNGGIGRFQKPLRRVPLPPESYKEYRAITHGLYDEDLIIAIRKFFKEHSTWRTEVKRYISRLLEIRDYNYENTLVKNDKPLIGDGVPPIEMIDIRDREGNKTGNVQPMQIIDFDYEYSGDGLRERKIYMPVNRDWWMRKWTMPKPIADGIEKARIKEEKRKASEPKEAA